MKEQQSPSQAIATRREERNITAITEGGAAQLTEQQIVAQAVLVQRVMRAVMKPNVHYGLIPGAGDKPVLLKPGSEVILSTFRIAADPEVEDLSTDDVIRYRVRAVGRHMGTGEIVGYGIGECSSNEEKYKWRRTVCAAEFDSTPPDRRRVAYKRGRQNSTYTIDQVRTNPADIANTVLKMAKKRAQVDLTLTATAASDSFDQDLEELGGVIDLDTSNPPADAAPEPAQSQGAPANQAPKAASEGPDITYLETQILEIKTSDQANNLLDACRGIDDPGVRKRLNGLIRDAMKKIAPAPK